MFLWHCMSQPLCDMEAKDQIRGHSESKQSWGPQTTEEDGSQPLKVMGQHGKNRPCKRENDCNRQNGLREGTPEGKEGCKRREAREASEAKKSTVVRANSALVTVLIELPMEGFFFEPQDTWRSVQRTFFRSLSHSPILISHSGQAHLHLRHSHLN